jgi:hypothetical protein
MLSAYGHPDQENSTIFTPNFIFFLRYKIHAAPPDIITPSYGTSFTSRRDSSNG